MDNQDNHGLIIGRSKINAHSVLIFLHELNKVCIDYNSNIISAENNFCSTPKLLHTKSGKIIAVVESLVYMMHDNEDRVAYKTIIEGISHGSYSDMYNYVKRVGQYDQIPYTMCLYHNVDAYGLDNANKLVVLGGCCFTTNHPQTNKAYIDHVKINRDYRRQGVASALIKYTMSRLQQLGVKQVQLDSNDQQYVRNLYEKSGMSIDNDAISCYVAYKLDLDDGNNRVDSINQNIFDACNKVRQATNKDREHKKLDTMLDDMIK